MIDFSLWSGLLIPITIVLLILFYAFRILREYERAVVFMLGRLWKVKGPGLRPWLPWAVGSNPRNVSLKSVPVMVWAPGALG